MAEGVQIIWTPWRHHGELLQNRAWLYPHQASDGGVEGSDMRREACDQNQGSYFVVEDVKNFFLKISAWKLRGNLPHAVESSWLLTEAVLVDEMPAERMPIFAVKAAYITAISRFVTGLLDSQQESKYKVSMYAKAQQIGLPALFVDLRHESTHGDMPSLTNLRSAASRALKWLWEDYWGKLVEKKGLQSSESMGEAVEDVVNPSGNDGSGQFGDDAVEGFKRHENVESDAASEEGGWKKWQGHWTTRPIGVIGTH